MKAKLKIEDGKLIIEGLQINLDGNIELECSEEDLKELLEKKLAKSKKTGYEKTNRDKIAYVDDGAGMIDNVYGWRGETEDVYYDAANYYSDYTVACNNARADKLMRQLRRFAAEHREKELDWNHPRAPKHMIRFGYYQKELVVCTEYYGRDFGNIFFDSKEAAQLAIDTFNDELIWYFTEYKDSL